MSDAPNVQIAFDTKRFARELELSERAVLRGAEVGLDRVAGDALSIKNRFVNRTYRRRIPQSATGRPKWERKAQAGGWVAGQRVVKTGQYERQVKTVGVQAADPITNYPEGYEQRLADPSFPTGPDGVNRRNPAAQDAADMVRPKFVKMMEDGIREFLRRERFL